MSDSYDISASSESLQPSAETAGHILDGTPGQILEHVFDRRIPYIYPDDEGFPHATRLRVLSDDAWREHDQHPDHYYSEGAPKAPESPLGKHAFEEFGPDTQFDSPSAFRVAVFKERNARKEQSVYFDVLDGLTASATKPEHLLKAVEVYTFLGQYAKGEFLLPRAFTRTLVNASVNMVSDPDTGMVDVEEAADIAEPAVMQLLEGQYKLHPESEKRKINGQIGAALTGSSETVRGLAEQVTGLRIRERLHRTGHEGFAPNDTSKRYNHMQGQYYPSRATLNNLAVELAGFGYSGLHEGSSNLVTVQNVISKVLGHLAHNNAVAGSILGAYDKLKYDDTLSNRQFLPLVSTLIIANAVTRDINAREGLEGDQQLAPLDTNGFAELPIAFERILYVINPDLLAQANQGPIINGNLLRSANLYINLLIQRWNEKGMRGGPSVGDAVLRFKASGLSDQEVVTHLNRMSKSKRPSETIEAIGRDKGLKKRDVVFKRTKPGHGLLT